MPGPAPTSPARAVGHQPSGSASPWPQGQRWPPQPPLGITLPGVLRGNVSPRPLLSGPRVRLQLHYVIPGDHRSFSRDGGEQKERPPSPQGSGEVFCTKMQETSTLALRFFCSSASSEHKCRMLLREQGALRVTYRGEQLR